MKVKTRCPNGHSLKVETRLTGKKVKCPKCRAPFVVNLASSSPAPEDVRAVKQPHSQKPPSAETAAGAKRRSHSNKSRTAPRQTTPEKNNSRVRGAGIWTIVGGTLALLLIAGASLYFFVLRYEELPARDEPQAATLGVNASEASPPSVRVENTIAKPVSQESKRELTVSNLRALAMALHDHHDNHLRFPPATPIGPDGKTPHSWRVAILPYLNRKDLYDKYRLDEPWDSPANKTVLNQMPDVFRSPFDDPKSTNTGYFAIVGPRTMFGRSQGVAIKDVLDGCSKTLLIVESKRDVPWTKPEDIPLKGDVQDTDLGGFVDGQFALAWADIRAHFVNKDDVKDRITSIVLRDDLSRSDPGEVSRPQKSQPDRPADKNARTLFNLKALGQAMHDYHDNRLRFPPATLIGPDGKTVHSWRVALLPYLNRKDLYDQYRLDEPWDSPANKMVLQQMPDVFRSPFDDPETTDSGYFAIVGPGSAFDTEDGTRIQQFQDGTRLTLLLVECKRPIPWTKPEDILFDPQKPLPNLGGFLKGKFAATLADGTAKVFDQQKVQKRLKWWIIKNDLQPPDTGSESEPVARKRALSAEDMINQARANMSKLSRAIHDYHDRHLRFPPAAVNGPGGKTAHSWRVALLPYLDHQDLYDQYRMDEPWDSPANKKVLEQMPDVFRYPSDELQSTKSGYYVFVGPGAMFEGTISARIRDIGDGTSNTLLFVQTQRGIPWTKPEDIPFDADTATEGLEGLAKKVLVFATGDGMSYFVPIDQIKKHFKHLVLRNDKSSFSLEGALRPPKEFLPDLPRPKGKKEQSQFNLKMLGLAMHRYHDTYLRFPPAVLIGPDKKSQHSWRVALLPFLDQKDLYDQYRMNEPWDSPANRDVLAQMPEIFRSPYDAPETTNSGYYVITGPGTMFDESKVIRLRDIRDGMKNTLMIVESKQQIPWTKPDDIPFDPEQPVPKIGGFLKGKLGVTYASGFPGIFDIRKSKDRLKWFIMRSDGRPAGRK